MFQVSSNSAESVKVLLRNIRSAQTKGNYNPTVVPCNKSCPQYLEGGKVSSRGHGTMCIKLFVKYKVYTNHSFHSYEYLAIIPNK